MLELVESVRPTFDPAEKLITIAFPSGAAKGQTLYLALVHPSADTPTLPDGWTSVASSGDSTSTVSTFVRQVQAQEASTISISLSAVSGEWHGVLALFSGAFLTNLIEETRADAAFSAATSLPAPSVTCLQAIDIEFAIWTCAGTTEVPAVPAGFTAIDGYTTSLDAARATLFAYAIANATGTVSPGDATTTGAATGHAFSILLRDALPIQPLSLIDDVPGSIGLIGVDNRPKT